MKNYRFRNNWLGLIVLQRLTSVRGRFGELEYSWRDATTQDLRDYYKTLCQLEPCTCQTQRELFEQQCG